MVLQPLEFSECLVDSPHFREKLFCHEKELERMSRDLKGLIAECKGLIDATAALSKAQRHFSATLMNFQFETIGAEETDEEKIIGNSLKTIGSLISAIEDERDRMIERSYRTIIEPLERFRKEKIGAVKEGKKKFDKQTGKFCQSLEKYLALKSKTNDTVLKEEDAKVEMEKHHFYQASMEYVLLLQEMHERKKFEFVEIMILFINSWLTFYHQGHEVAEEYRKDILQDVQLKIQKCRDNFDSTREETEALMKKTLEIRGTKTFESGVAQTINMRDGYHGYLYVMEKKALGTAWIKTYCSYVKSTKLLTLVTFNQSVQAGKAFPQQLDTEQYTVTSCTRRATDSIEKRFCFDITCSDRTHPLTLQATSEEERKLWMDAMDGKEPIYSEPSKPAEGDSLLLDDVGNKFILKCLRTIESRGLEELGLYRIVGVQSKVTKLLSIGLDPKKVDKLVMDDEDEWEIKTITSAVKSYLRSLPEPLLTFKLHPQFVLAAKQEAKTLRVNDIHELVHQLPFGNFETLKHLIFHLKKIAQHSDQNLMTVANLAVCFGPTIMKPPEETVAAIMNIKFCNLVVEILITYCDKIFDSAPDGVDISNTRVFNKPQLPDKPASMMSPKSLASPRLDASQRMSEMPVSHVTRPNRPERPAVSAYAVGAVQPVDRSMSTVGPLRIDRRSQLPAGLSGAVHTALPDKGPQKHERQLDSRESYILTSISSAASQSSPGNHSQTSNSSTAATSPSGVGIPILRTHSMPASELLVRANRATNGERTSHQVPSNGSRGGWSHGQRPQAVLRTSPVSRHTTIRADGASSGSTESLNSHSSSVTQGSGDHLMTASTDLSAASSGGGSVQRALQKLAHYHTTKPSSSGGKRKHIKRKSADSVCFFSSASSTSSANNARMGPMARTLYSCKAEHPSELSFEANQFVFNVHKSNEPGWLEGTIDGQTGLIPANYIEYLDCSPSLR